MPQPRIFAVALSALLVAPLAVQAAAPRNPFGPEVKTLALRVVDAPDAIAVKGEGIDIAGAIYSTLLLGAVIGISASVTDDAKAQHGDRADAAKLLTTSAPALERFALHTRLAADLQRAIEGNGWADVVGEPALVALADPAAEPGKREAESLAQTPAALLEGSGADAVLVIRPRLTLEERARVLRLRFDLDAYSRRSDGALRHDYSHRSHGSASRAIDGKRTPPKTKRGQILDYGGRWLADDAARLRAEYELLVAREMPRALSQLRESRFWSQEQADPRR